MESEREGWGGRVRKRHVATLRARTQRTNEQVPPPSPPPLYLLLALHEQVRQTLCCTCIKNKPVIARGQGASLRRSRGPCHDVAGRLERLLELLNVILGQ